MNHWKVNHYCEQWIADWCQENGWTDWFLEQRCYWAFPPHAVLPMPIPAQVLRTIKIAKGISPDERQWLNWAIGSLLCGSSLSWLVGSPMPVLAAFGFCAVAAAKLEDEEF
jgi:hypothetical protein